MSCKRVFSSDFDSRDRIHILYPGLITSVAGTGIVSQCVPENLECEMSNARIMMISTDTFELVFLISAIAGTASFVFKAIVSLTLGEMHDIDTDLGAGDIAHDGIQSSDAAFELFSITSLTGFFMMFGWSGLAAYKEFSLSQSGTFGCALLVGFVAMYGTAKLFSAARLLVSKGSVFVIENTLDKPATVYQMIPVDGTGVIQITIDGQVRELGAQSADGVEIPSFTTVKVVSVVDTNTVKVSRV